MLSKIAGGALVVAAASGIGCKKAARYKSRVKDISAFSSGLWLLKSEIDFSGHTLSHALKLCANLIPENVSRIFCLTANYIDGGDTPGEAFDKAADSEADSLAIENEEKAVLCEFFAVLGTKDTETEKENIEKTIKRLKACEKAARENNEKYGKLCRVCGVSAGILTAVFLF